MPRQESTSELFRAVNVRIRTSADGPEDLGDLWQFHCECGADGCGAVVELTLTEFDALVEQGEYVIAADHVRPDEVPDRDDRWL
jgi:hypothetical protein